MIVTVARVPLIPASKKVVVICPLSADDEADCACWLACWLGQTSLMVLEQETVTVFVIN